MPWNTSAILHSCGKIKALLNHTQLPSSLYYTHTDTHPTQTLAMRYVQTMCTGNRWRMQRAALHEPLNTEGGGGGQKVRTRKAVGTIGSFFSLMWWQWKQWFIAFKHSAPILSWHARYTDFWHYRIYYSMHVLQWLLQFESQDVVKINKFSSGVLRATNC